jgi:transitional endoplasmic reticulum ATPase
MQQIEKTVRLAQEAMNSGDSNKAKDLFRTALTQCRDFIQKNPHEDLDKINQLVEALSSKIVKLSSPNPSEKRETPKNRLDFNQIIGHEQAKLEIKENLIEPLDSPEIHKRFKIQISKGILMYGPPGTGKTTFAKAVANEINAQFIHIQSNEVLDKYVGESEKKLKGIFEEAEKQRSIILFDEFDQIASSEQTTDVSKRLIAQLKELIDGFSSSENIFILAATNYPELIEFGIRRRLTPIYLGLPNEEEIIRLLELKLKGMPVSNDLNIEQFGSYLLGYSGSDITNIVNKSARLAANRERIKQGENPAYSTVIDEMDLAEAIKSTQRTISAEDLKKYDLFKQSLAH